MLVCLVQFTGLTTYFARMFKNPLSLLTLLFLSFAATAQPKDKSSFTFAVGPSIPVAKFANDEPTTNSSGLAKTGVFFNLAYNYQLKKKFGLSAMLHVQQNALNRSAIEENFNKTVRYGGLKFHNILRPDPRQLVLGPGFGNWEFEKAQWRTISLLLGGYLQLSSGESQKLNVMIRLLLGPSYLSSPAISGAGITDTTTAIANQTKEHVWGLGLLSGFVGQYTINERFFAMGAVDFFGTSRMIIKDMTQSTTGTYKGAVIIQGTITEDARQLITCVNVSVGIGLRF